MLKFELHRMKRAGCVVSPSRGRYHFVQPSIWTSVVQASKKFPRLLGFAELFTLEGIMGIYLYGSWARGEASRSSDYDLLIVVRDLSRARLKRKPPKADVRVLGMEEIIELVKKDPILIVPILRESAPVYGGELLEYLKSLGFNEARLLASLREALISIALAEDIIKATKEREVDSTLLYPLMLRFRQYCLVRSVIEGAPGTLKQAERIALERGLGRGEFQELYEAFRSEQREIQRKIAKTKLMRFLKLVRGLVKEYVEKHRPKEIKTGRLKQLEKLKEEFQKVLHVAEKASAERPKLT